MDKNLRVASFAFYVLATMVIATTFYRDAALRSWLAIGHGVTLYLVSVVMPALWTRTLVARLRQRGVALDDLHLAIVMPSWCAVIAALLALNLQRGV